MFIGWLLITDIELVSFADSSSSIAFKPIYQKNKQDKFDKLFNNLILLSKTLKKLRIILA